MRRGYPLNDNYGVLSVGAIHLVGDITASPWRSFIVHENGKQNTAAITILSKLAYLHRPLRETDLVTQEEMSWHKMFAGEFYWIDYRAFGDFLQLTGKTQHGDEKSHGISMKRKPSKALSRFRLPNFKPHSN